MLICYAYLYVDELFFTLPFSLLLEFFLTLRNVSGFTADCFCILYPVQVAAELAQVGGVSKLLVAEDAALDGLLPERVTPVLLAAHKQFNFSHIIGERHTLS